MTTPNTTTGAITDIVKTAFDLAALYDFRANSVFRETADIFHDISGPPMRGNVVQWTRWGKLAVATSAISETADVAPVAMTDTTFTATLLEYGNTVQPTKKLRLVGFTPVDSGAVHEITANMEESVDLIARATLVAGTNVQRPGGVAQNALTATDVMTAALMNYPSAKFRGFFTPIPAKFSHYQGIIHPDVSYDVRLETGQAAWNAPHTYPSGQQDPLYGAMIGVFANAVWFENANASIVADVNGTVDAYQTIVVGAQALGEAVGEAQHVIIAGPFDNLQRFPTFSWYALLGFTRARENSIYRLETASSIGAN